MLDEVNIYKVIIVYELVWLIGIGIILIFEEVENVSVLIYKLISFEVFVLYGGSVNENNINDFINLFNLNGFLVGLVSLKIDKFLKIIFVNFDGIMFK